MRSAILTGQYVKIEQPTASPGDRMVAQLIDWVLQVAYLTLAVTQFRGLSPENFILLVILPIIAYPLLAEVLGQGQTIGKWVRGIRVVMADGSTPTLSAYLLRWLLIIVDGPMMSYLGILVIALTQRHQRIGDMAAGTVVVRLGTWKKLKVSLRYEYLKLV
jgi:uncharacterized RDD family membrane protein YckC